MDESQYPGVDLAYDIALNSYEWATKRFDAIDARIQTILGVGISLTLAVPVAASTFKLSLNNPFFIGGMLFFLLGLALGTHARLMGEIKLLTPRVLFEKWLRFDAAEFKKNFIYFAGEHMEQNVGVIAAKHRLLVIVTLIFFLELVCLAVAVAIADPIHP